MNNGTIAQFAFVMISFVGIWALYVVFALDDYSDSDGDGVLDINDECPNSPESWNDFDDHDGCYDEHGIWKVPYASINTV